MLAYIKYLSFISLFLISCSTHADDAGEFKKYQVDRDISYDSCLNTKLDIYYNNINDGVSPVLCYVHGGGWNSGDKSSILSLVDFFMEQGYIVVSINYSLSPNPIDISASSKIRYPQHIRETSKALQWIAKNIKEYGGNPKDLILLGHSAGAHIVGQLLLDTKYLSPNTDIAVSNAILIDGGAYLCNVPDLLQSDYNIYMLMQNALGVRDIDVKSRFFCSNLILEMDEAINVKTNIILICSDYPYRKKSNQYLFDLATQRGLTITLVTLGGHDHDSTFSQIPNYWNDVVSPLMQH